MLSIFTLEKNTYYVKWSKKKRWASGGNDAEKQQEDNESRLLLRYTLWFPIALSSNHNNLDFYLLRLANHLLLLSSVTHTATAQLNRSKRVLPESCHRSHQ